VSEALSWPAENWSALASWVTVTIATVAGGIAIKQLREARSLRREQAQPYVAVFMERNAADPKLMDLVVRNFGTTAATDVVLKIDPPPRRVVVEGHEDVWLPERIPTLVPGQEWRQLWDSTPERADADLPDRHNVLVTFRDSLKKNHRCDYVLDWSAVRKRLVTDVLGVHDVAKSLREIGEAMRPVE
jgi:hypothetical protein